DDPELPGHVLVAEAWREGADGWRPTGPPLTLRRKPWQTEAIAFDPRWTDASGTLPVRRIDALRMLVARSGTRDVVLVAVSVHAAEDCCLSVLQLRERPGGGLAARSLLELATPADLALAADLDGDGTDELVTRDPGSRQRQWGSHRMDESVARGVRVWRLADGRLVQAAEASFAARMGHPFVLGESDGRPGAELAMIEQGGVGRLVRISLAAGGLALEETSLFTSSDPRREFTGAMAVRGAGLLIVNTGRTILADWPAGRAPRWKAEIAVGGRLLGAIGSGEGARIVLQEPFTGRLRILDSALRPVRNATAADAAPLDGSGRRWLPRYGGQLPGGLPDGRQAILADGLLVAEPTARGAEGGSGVEVEPASPLAATHPVGILGRGGGWMATIRGLDRQERRPEGGPLRRPVERPAAWLGLVPAGDVLSGAPAPRLAAMSWEHAAVVGEERGVVELAVDAAGYRAVVDPAAASIILQPDGGAGGEAPAERTGEGQGPVTLAFDAPEADGELRMLAAVTADGAARELVWRVSEVVEAPPGVDVAASTELLAPAASVSGSARGAGTVVIDGRRHDTSSDGRFAAVVEAGLWPRAVLISATDRLGREATAEVVVVGFVDYLSHPWLPAMPMLLLAAVWAFRRGRLTEPHSGGDELVELDVAAVRRVERDAAGSVAGILPERRRYGTRHYD
ncbi:MAG TPA: hypothetical protein VHK06_06125, partial [Candidatus Limnocylindria bacterium]|nr:hypothetical protein [Candidatus Limnocylindria bacterium]